MIKSIILRGLLLPAAIILIIGCQPSMIGNKSELNHYISQEKNGLINKRTVRGAEISMRYLPWQLLASRIDKTGNQDKDYEVSIEKMRDQYFFVLSFSKDGKELLSQLDFNTYSEMVQVLSFRMLDKINLYAQDDSYDALDCIFQQMYGLSGSNELLIIFDSQKIKNANSFSIGVKEFGLNLGNLRFDFNTEDINKLSDLDYQKL